MHAIQKDGDVEVDDVAIFQDAIVRNAVTDHFVHTCAHALWIVVIIERARIATHLNREVVNKNIDFVGGDTGANKLACSTKNLFRRDTSNTHALNNFRSLDASLFQTRNNTSGCIGRRCDVCRHDTHRTDDAWLDATLGALVATLVFAATATPARIICDWENLRGLGHTRKATGD